MAALIPDRSLSTASLRRLLIRCSVRCRSRRFLPRSLPRYQAAIHHRNGAPTKAQPPALGRQSARANSRPATAVRPAKIQSACSCSARASCRKVQSLLIQSLHVESMSWSPSKSGAEQLVPLANLRRHWIRRLLRSSVPCAQSRRRVPWTVQAAQKDRRRRLCDGLSGLG